MPVANSKHPMRRSAALARLEVEDLAERLAEEHARHDRSHAVDSLIELLEAHIARIRAALDARIGVSVQQAADRLDVSEPTVRKWLAEGLLERIEGSKPIELTPQSVLKVDHVLEQVRDRFPARRWTDALAALLHDRDLLDQDWARRGIVELERGELVER